MNFTLLNKIINYIIEILKSILKPVQVTYSNELLANQINDISILLFILTYIGRIDFARSPFFAIASKCGVNPRSK